MSVDASRVCTAPHAVEATAFGTDACNGGGGGGGPPLGLVDSEGKACRLSLLSFGAPHMRSFHLAWLSHFVAVLATFAAAPLLPVIRDNLDLTKSQVAAAGIAAVAGTVASRVVMGGVCDRWGPRHGAAALLLLTASATFGMAAVEDAAGYLAARLFIGCSLAAFVSCQYWCSVMFTPRIVGTANAVAAGWGNSAGGFVQLLMPLLLAALEHSQPQFIAWRNCYFVVGWLQVVVGLLVLTLGQDLPGGNFGALRRRGDMIRPNTAREYWAACRNYRTWILCICYGFSFGMELTMNNVLSQYLYDQFNTNLTAAGALASLFGFCNLFSRPAGGLLSDLAARRLGMRGRLWVLYLLQSVAAAFCCGLSRFGGSLGGTMAMAVCMALAVTAASGATFGVVPFVSRRGLGAVNGIVGSGSSLGSILLQALFFTGSSINWSQGFLLMGFVALAATCLLFAIHFPMWGGMLPWPAPPAAQASLSGLSLEEAYYSRDFTAEERQRGLHHSVLRFAAESVSQRGSRRAGALAEGATVHCQCGPLAATMAAATASTAAASRGMAPPAGSRSRVAVHNMSAGKAFVGEGG
ncbi:hypothetical protein ABPG77_009890 [Micractinium sp. CCAP 211/92]